MKINKNKVGLVDLIWDRDYNTKINQIILNNLEKGEF